MKIDISKLYTLWYEDENANKYTNIKDYMTEFYHNNYDIKYQHSESPNTITHNCLRLIKQPDVDKCKHSNTKPTYGWIEGIEGRKCLDCHGSQTRRVDDEWSNHWNGSGSISIFTGTTSYSPDLVLAMSRPSLSEILKSMLRGYFFNKKYTFNNAVLIAARSCEKCVNSLGYKYGLNWGYKEYSDEWNKSSTSCNFCSVD